MNEINEIIVYLDRAGLVLASVVVFLIGAFVYLQNRKSIINKTFAIMSFIFSVWGWGALFRHTTDNPLLFTISINFTRALAALAMLYVLYFILVFPKGKDLSAFKKFLLFTPSILITSSVLFTDMFVRGYDPLQKKVIFGPLEGLYLLYVLFYTVLSLTVILVKLIRYKGKEKEQVFLVAVAFFIGAIVSQFFALLLPQIGLVEFESLGRVIFIFTNSIIAYGIIRYKLFLITPQVAAEELINALGDILMVSNLRGEVIYRGNKLTGLKEEERKNCVEEALARSENEVFRLPVMGVPNNVSASFLLEGGGLVMVFDNISEVEREEEKERDLHKELSEKFKKERATRQVLQSLITGKNLGQTIKAAVAMLGNDPSATKALVKMEEIIKAKQHILDDVKRDKESLQKYLEEIKQVNRELVERELLMVDLKSKIKDLKSKE
jgi:hypothetical protein